MTGVLLGALVWILLLFLYAGDFLESYELKTYDQLCRWVAKDSAAPPEIVLIVVDQGSLEAARKEGINWPWPRQMYAPILEFCTSSGAKAVALDILFTEPSAYGLEDDKILAGALKQNGSAFLPVFLSRERRPSPSGEKEMKDRIALLLQDQSKRSHSLYLSSIQPIPLLANQARSLGNVAIPPDPDGIYRRLPLVFQYGEHWIPSLGLAVFRHVTGDGTFVLQPEALFFRNRPIPLDPQGNFLLTYYGESRPYRQFSAFNVIQSFQALREKGKPIYSPEHFRDKIIFVGFTAPGLFDLKPTPISSVYPGVAIHATQLANLLRGEFRLRLSSRAAMMLAAIVAVTTGIMVMLIPNLWQLALIASTFAGALGFFVFFAFRHNLWVDGILLWASLGLSFAMSTAFSYATEGRQRRQIKRIFSHYMSDLLIQDLMKYPEKVRLGGERRVLTVFFSDLAGFTSLSEKLTPEQVVALLNRYLTAMTDIILESGGIIDKYEGDAIMAFWGAPLPQADHALRACMAALDNQARLAELRQEFLAAGLPSIHARIGINTGEMIIGNMGSNQRFDFTVIGDSVNLASRLEGAGKEYGVWITISEDTYQQASPQVEVRELDLLRVKGKEKPVRIYELLSRKGELDEKKQKLRTLFAEGLRCYREQRWPEAISLFQGVLQLEPQDGPASTFIRRSREFSQKPPEENWDGVYRLATK